MQTGTRGQRRAALGIVMAWMLVPSITAADEEHVREVEEWHAWRIGRLLEPTGWMTLVGLYQLPDGESTFGSAEDNDLVLPEFAPAHAGVLRIDAGQVSIEIAEGVVVTVDDAPITSSLLRSDMVEDTTVLTMGRLQFYLLERGDKRLLRVRDLEHPSLSTFEGIERYPISKEWRKKARFERFDPPRILEIPDVLGNVYLEECPGAAVFEHEGREIRLYPTRVGDELFFVFSDATNGDETYGGGRYLYVPIPPEDEMFVDFNRSYNPPCVFTPYSTCTLPTAENTMDFPILAGEKVYHGYEH